MRTYRAKSRQEIAQEFGISAKTLTRWIQKENLPITRGLVSPKEQSLIYLKFGVPQKAS
ncbi:Helix-turn-helix domain-containing protein [Algoriphagus faecimaris]|uniref:Helix-turn-helix domain-containing protein n=1 Tax=Algoriphagus faecimaris TaxID=686796 RepID=A0A1G6MF07_9BACT|nr:helix-turn-helix domain-containing protein [Algoriphagus faecimaris]SDC54031.1 Helix-turn-helix domain-containing protein [Algoriphagus faecimaris]